MKEEFCIFFDILGTTSNFKGIKNDEEEVKLLDRYERLMEIIRYEARKIYISKGKIKYFSDNVFVSTPKNKLKELYNLLDFISICQIRSITECNLSIRGGVAFDTIRNKDGILMGKGLIKAHEEEGKAVYPWVKFNKETVKIYNEVLSEKRKEKASKVKGATRKNIEKVKKVLKEEEGWTLLRIFKIRNGAFLNYLDVLKDNKDILNILKKHKEFITKELKKDLNKLNRNQIKFIELKDQIILKMFKYFSDEILVVQLKKNLESRNNFFERKTGTLEKIKILESEMKALKKERKTLRKESNQFISELKEKKYVQNKIMKVRQKYLFLAFYHHAMVEHFILEKKLRKEDRENKIDYSKLYN